MSKTASLKGLVHECWRVLFSWWVSRINNEVERFFVEEGIAPDEVGTVDLELSSSLVVERIDDGDIKISRFGEHDLSSGRTRVIEEVENLSHRSAEGNFSDIVIDEKEAIADGIHEKSHDLFHNYYDVGTLPESTSEDFDEANQIFFNYREENPEEAVQSVDGNSVVCNPDFFRKLSVFQRDLVEEKYGRDNAEEFEDFIALRGIDEAAARVLQHLYRRDSDLDPEMYNGSEPIAYTAKMADVLGVKDAEVLDYLEDNTYKEFLSMSEEELLDKFYKPLPGTEP